MRSYEQFVPPNNIAECIEYLDIHFGHTLVSWHQLDLGVLQQMTIKTHAREASVGDWTPNGGEGSTDLEWWRVDEVKTQG